MLNCIGTLHAKYVCLYHDMCPPPPATHWTLHVRNWLAAVTVSLYVGICRRVCGWPLRVACCCETSAAPRSFGAIVARFSRSGERYQCDGKRSPRLAASATQQTFQWRDRISAVLWSPWQGGHSEASPALETPVPTECTPRTFIKAGSGSVCCCWITGMFIEAVVILRPLTAMPGNMAVHLVDASLHSFCLAHAIVKHYQQRISPVSMPFDKDIRLYSSITLSSNRILT